MGHAGYKNYWEHNKGRRSCDLGYTQPARTRYLLLLAIQTFEASSATADLIQYSLGVFGPFSKPDGSPCDKSSDGLAQVLTGTRC